MVGITLHRICDSYQMGVPMFDHDRYDSRVIKWMGELRELSYPQLVYCEKASQIRAERAEGAVRLYRYKDILAVNRHPAVLGVGGRGGSFGNNKSLVPLEIDGEEHRKWRRILDPLFAPKQVARMEESVRALARHLIDDFVPNGRAELYRDFCVPLPCLTFLRLIGAPAGDLDFFLEFKDGVIHPQGETLEELNANMASSGAKLIGYFAGFLANKRSRADRDDDVITRMINTEIDGVALNDDDLVNVLFLLIFAGLDTVTSALSLILAWLGNHPAETASLVADTSLIPMAVEELMRFESPVPSGVRYATEDIDLGDGLVIHGGEAIHAQWSSANLDPTYFDDPLAVDFRRGRRDHMVFASGTHRCLGSHLARLELKLALEEFLLRIPEFATDPSEPLSYDNVAVRMVTHLPVTFPASNAGAVSRSAARRPAR